MVTLIFWWLAIFFMPKVICSICLFGGKHPIFKQKSYCRSTWWRRADSGLIALYLGKIAILIQCWFLSWRSPAAHDHDQAFFALLAISGNSSGTGEFSSQRPVTRSLMFSLIYVWTNGWIKNEDAGGLRRHRAHYDVTVTTMVFRLCFRNG